MGNITIEQILAAGGTVIGLAALAWKLWSGFKTAVSNAVADQFKGLARSIEDINAQIKKVDMESCKNYLVRCLSDLEKGEELSEAAKIRYGEQYDYYINHGENSYIKSGTEKYRAEGKL